jgi:hypothetical protein
MEVVVERSAPVVGVDGDKGRMCDAWPFTPLIKRLILLPLDTFHERVCSLERLIVKNTATAVVWESL